MTGATTTVIVIRHGETRWNVEGRYQGHGDSPLTPLGRKQIAAAARRLAAAARPHALVTSDLGRTLASAAIIAERIGLSPTPDARLRERHFGILEGLTAEEIRARHPSVFAALAGNDPDYIIPGGESLRQHYRRNISFLTDWVAAHPGQTLAVVAHGGVLDSIYRFVNAIALDRPRSIITTNASISVFRHGVFYDTLRWVLDTWGDTCHLSDIGHGHDG